MKKAFTLIITMIMALASYGQDLDEHRWQDRLIIVYADFNNEEGQRQIELLRNKPEELRERSVKVYYRSQGAYRYDFGKKTEISQKKIEFDIPFKVELIGLDGGVKFRASEVTEPQVLIDLIDSMPMRKSEMKRKGNR